MWLWVVTLEEAEIELKNSVDCVGNHQTNGAGKRGRVLAIQVIFLQY